MSVWKSPILYVGIALVLFVTGLLSAPFTVDWNSYRASIEDYGTQLTGRNVVISGDISARLFPWPRLRLEGVRIANRPGAAMPDLVKAEAIEARMLLGSLISGYVEVSDIRVEKPVFAFERLESGQGNWWLDPQLKAGIPIGAEHISVEDLEIVDGKIFLSDNRRGGTAQFDDFDAVLSSQTLLGPWKARGQLRRKNQVLSVGVSTGKHRPGEPFKFGVKLTPVNGPGLVYSFDGEYSSKGDVPVSGILRAEPFVDENGKADSQAQVRAVTFKSKLAFKEDHALLQEIEIAPADREQLGNLLTGNAAIELQSRISVMADLRAPKFDLDGMLGSEGREVLKSGAVLEGFSQFIELLPEGVDGRLILNVGTLTAGGEKLEGARLEAELADSGLIIHQLSATMPGQTKARFSGLLFASSERPQLAGDIEIDAANARELVSWLMPEWKAAIADHWSGARGRLSLRSKVDHAPLSLRLTESRFTLDESSASGEVTLTGGDHATNDIRLRIDKLDLDRYLPKGLGLSNIPGEALTRVAEVASGAGALGDVRLSLQADSVWLNGAEARDVRADVAAIDRVVEIRSINIGKVGDAKLEISGILEPGNESTIGSATVKVDAEDPRPLLHLLGLIPPVKVGELEPAWAGELAPLRATLSAHIDSRKTESEVKLAMTGVAGGSNISVSSTFLGDLSDLRSGRLAMVGDVTSPNAKKLAALFGIAGQSSETEAARLTIGLDGEVRSGLMMQTELRALGASGKLSGRLDGLFADASELKMEGVISVDAENGDLVLRALGIPNPRPGAALRLGSSVSIKPHHLELADLKAWVGEQQFDGRFTLGGGKIDVAARAEEISVPWLLSLAIMPTDGRPINDVTLFAQSPLGGATGRLVIDAQRMAMVSGLRLDNGRAEINAKGDRLQISITGSGARGTPFSLKADMAREANELRMKGSVEGGLELSELLSAPDGEPVIDSLVTFKSTLSGAGRSPAGLAASLSGTGEMKMPNGFVRGIDAQSFMAGLRFSPTSAGVDRLLRRGFTGSDLIFSGGPGGVIITDGTATFGPVPFEAGGIEGSIKTIVELLSGKVDLGVQVRLKSLGDVPPVEVAYAGPPDRLERSVDASELKARLSAAELKENMEKLEKLQREQMELFAEDDRQAKEAGEQRAEAEALQRRSRANRQRAEDAAVRAQAEEQKRAFESALELDRNELRRRAEVMEQRRQAEEQQRRALEAAVERHELQRMADAAERRRQSETAAKERAEEERKAQEAALELERQRQAEEAERRRLVEEAARKAEEERKAQEAALELERQRQAEEAERQRLAEEAARKAEEERKAQEAALELERQRLAEEAARKAEEERKAQEAALELERQRQAEEAERQRLAEEAARKAEEERKAQEAALELERQRQAEEAERQRLAEEAAQKAEEERKAQEAALELERQRQAEEAERQRLAEEAARKAEEERKAQEAALELERQRQAEEAERQRLAEEAARKAEEERKAQEAALALERQRLAEEAAQKAEEERKAQEAALELERQRQAEEAERQRLAEEAARKAEEERKAQEAALALERQRLAEEAERKRLVEEAARIAEEERKAQEAALELERQRLAEEAARKAEEERKAQEAALALERQRLAEEAARKAEEERKAQEAALELERQRQAEEAEQQRLVEEAARKAEEERKALEAALELERQRQAEEAERKRLAALQRTRNLALREMNVQELIQQLQRTAAWNITSQRAKELAAQRALEEAKAKIDQLLQESKKDPTGTTPIAAPSPDEPRATESITAPIADQSLPELPPAEPLPIEDGDAAVGPTLIDPSSTMSSASAKQSQLGASPGESITDADIVVEPQIIVPQNASQPTFLQRIERFIKTPPANKKEPVVRKKYNFNR